MRREKIITIKDRERELTFKIREMPATQAESWVMRAVLMVGRGSEDGINTVLRAVNSGGAEQAGAVLNLICSGVNYAEAKPLLDELLECCSRVEPGFERKCVADEVDGYIEDMRTLFKLKLEAAKLTLDFFTPESPSSSRDSEKPLSTSNKKPARKHIQMSEA